MSRILYKIQHIFVRTDIENFKLIVTEIHFWVQTHCNPKNLRLNYYDIFYFVYSISIIHKLYWNITDIQN
jgi:hypothetical protein